MSRYSEYSDDESDIDVHIRHRHASPARPARAPVAHYVEARRRPYYEEDRFLVPAAHDRMVVTTRSRSRDRRSRRDSSPAAPSQAPAPAPVVINNRIYNHSDSDSDSGSSHHMQVAHHHSRSRAGSSTYSRHDREDTRRDELERARRDFELERARKELQELKLSQKIEHEEKRRDKTYQEERDLREAKKELDEIRRIRQREEDEKRIKQKMELDRLREEEEQLAEKKRRDKEAKDAVERYKKDEAERILKEKREEEEREREYKHKMQEQLLKSGVSEKDINAILSGKKVDEKKEKEKEKAKHNHDDVGRPTYTRMPRKYLSIETLRVYGFDYHLDSDPEFVVIKRWVTEQEQDMLWRHTKLIREQRSTKLVMTIEDKKKPHHHHLEPDFEWVRKKERRRSKSPSLLMYLAGGKPA